MLTGRFGVKEKETVQAGRENQPLTLTRSRSPAWDRAGPSPRQAPGARGAEKDTSPGEKQSQVERLPRQQGEPTFVFWEMSGSWLSVGRSLICSICLFLTGRHSHHRGSQTTNNTERGAGDRCAGLAPRAPGRTCVPVCCHQGACHPHGRHVSTSPVGPKGLRDRSVHLRFISAELARVQSAFLEQNRASFYALFNHVKNNAHLAITLDTQGRLMLHIVDV